MATESSLGKIHIFPSEASYNTNKTDVAANDLAFVPTPRIPIETYRDGKDWYVKYSDGWIEQGGELLWSATRSALGKNLSFITPFTNTESITVALTAIVTGSYNATSGIKDGTLSTEQVVVNVYGLGSSDRSTGIQWRACGK